MTGEICEARTDVTYAAMTGEICAAMTDVSYAAMTGIKWISTPTYFFI